MKKCPEAFAYYMYQRNTENSEKLLTLSNLYHILQKEKHNTIVLTPNTSVRKCYGINCKFASPHIMQSGLLILQNSIGFR